MVAVLAGLSRKSLNTYLIEQSGVVTDQERARLFHEAAVRDANLQIVIISALLDHTQSTIDQD